LQNPHLTPAPSLVTALLCTTTRLIAAVPDHATFVELDHPTFGARTLTLDTTTGLQFLDINQTTGFSYNWSVILGIKPDAFL
jgi:hypothetical protein